jgi:hypothetical protein
MCTEFWLIILLERGNMETSKLRWKCILNVLYKGVSKSFWTESIMKYMLTFSIMLSRSKGYGGKTK